MRLQWSTTDITIPDAQLEDTTTYESNAIVRENRGLAPITFTAWPVNIRRRFSIKTMNLTEKTNLLALLIQSAGDEITITDHDNQVWLGIVTTAIPEIITVRDSCSYDAEWEIIGRRLS